MELGVVTLQPGQGIAPGSVMDILKEIDYLKIRQKVDLLEMITGWEVANKYEVFDSQDRMLLTVTEESALCERQCCGSSRGFVLHIQDTIGTEIAQIHRQFKCCAGCCCCCANVCCPFEMWVDAPIGRNIAHIQERSFCCHPKFWMLDPHGETMLTSGGPCCCFCQGPCCTADLDFPIYLPDGHGGHEAAKVTKIWDGIARGCFTNANTYGCHFPKNMDLNKKLAILGHVFELNKTSLPIARMLGVLYTRKVYDFLFFEYSDSQGS